MKKYVVHYKGAAYVEAEDELSAREVFFCDGEIADEKLITEVEEVDEFLFSPLKLEE